MVPVGNVQRIEPARLERIPEAIADVIAEVAARSAALGRALHPLTAANLAGLVQARYNYGNMAKTITPRELLNNSGQIIRELDSGQSFVVTHNGIPVAQLAPLGRGHFEKTANVLAAFAGTEPVDFGLLRADLDAVTD